MSDVARYSEPKERGHLAYAVSLRTKSTFDSMSIAAAGIWRCKSIGRSHTPRGLYKRPVRSANKERACRHRNQHLGGGDFWLKGIKADRGIINVFSPCKKGESTALPLQSVISEIENTCRYSRQLLMSWSCLGVNCRDLMK